MMQGQSVHPLPWLVCDIFQTQNLIDSEHDYNKFKHLYQLIFGSGA